MKKKIFLVLFAAIAGTSVLFADGTLIGELYYNLNTSKKTATVTYQDLSNNYPDMTAVNIPATVIYDGVTYNVTAVGQNAFMDCLNITSVTLPDGITEIARFAFRSCEITSLTIPASLKTMDYDAFFGCDKITSLTWNAVKCDDFSAASPWEYAGVGYNATAPITTVVFGDGVQRIPSHLLERIETLTSVTIPNSVNSIGKFAFAECKNLTKIDIPSSVTSIGADAFNKCENLTKIDIPNGIITIETGTFAECTNLKSVTIPNSVNTIKGGGGFFDVGAFYECSSLAEIYNYGETPANAYSAVFDGVNKSTCKLYVPRNSINLYKNAPVWRDFYSISAIEDVQAIEDVEADNVRSTKIIIDGKVCINRGDKVFTLQGQEVK